MATARWVRDLSVLPKLSDATVENFCAENDASRRQQRRAYSFVAETYAEPSSVATCTSDTSSDLILSMLMERVTGAKKRQVRRTQFK